MAESAFFDLPDDGIAHQLDVIRLHYMIHV